MHVFTVVETLNLIAHVLKRSSPSTVVLGMIFYGFKLHVLLYALLNVTV